MVVSAEKLSLAVEQVSTLRKVEKEGAKQYAEAQ